MTYTRSADFVIPGDSRRSAKLNRELDLIAAAIAGLGSGIPPDVLAALALKANIASPTLTGTPRAPTPTVTDDSTQIATTAYVIDAIGLAGTVAYPPVVGNAGKFLQTDGTIVQWATPSVSVAWADITGKPTTRSGYGITDANALMTVDEDGSTQVTDPTFLNFIGATVTANGSGADVDIGGSIPHFLLLAHGII